MNDLVLISIGILIIAGLGWVIFILTRKNQSREKDSLIMQQLNHMNQVLDSKLSESSKTIQNQFSQSAKIISNVTEKLTRLDETNKQVVGFADQLKSLQDVLKNPKQRGVLGE